MVAPSLPTSSSSPLVGLVFLKWKIILIEFCGKFTKTVKLNWKLWIISVVIGLAVGLLLLCENSYQFQKPHYHLLYLQIRVTSMSFTSSTVVNSYSRLITTFLGLRYSSVPQQVMGVQCHQVFGPELVHILEI
ncbi:hypothetical protein K2173_002536 [Erythroxylum novogranatense]|uniref:Uncharacterized protein n=1 Tax=Erythroxylum novogranatense TaxID=1862640 RepID=A0AAV8TQV7_9ROSI|nr:hypothetical protein K2173_002536 [Erythroxylum novogranatense]